MKKSPKLGFSLIELSIVILVIGILVVGITQGSRIIAETKLKSARSLTASSPVSSTEGLYFWIDSVSEKSFDANLSDGNAISTWYDINSQSITKFNLTQNSTARPTYRINGINNLPTVEFDGGDDEIANASFTFPYANYSIFIVFQAQADGSKELLNLGTGAGAAGINIETNSGGVLRFLHRFPYSGSGGNNNLSSSNSFTLNKNYILSYVRNLSTASTIAQLNGTNIINTTATIGSFDGSTLQLTIGNVLTLTRYFDGYINEVIIFNRALKNSERNAVEQYLSSKWGIRIS